MPINWTLVHSGRTNDESDAAGDVGEVAVTGWLHFVAQLPEGQPALAPLQGDTGASYWVRTFYGYLDSDGVLKNKPGADGGTPGVRLWANDPALNLDEPGLPYLVYAPKDLRANGKVVKFDPFVFYAPSSDVTVKFSELQPVPSATAKGLSRGFRGFRSKLVKVSAAGVTPPLYRWQDETGELWGPSQPYTEVFDDSAFQAAAQTVPGLVDESLADRDISVSDAGGGLAQITVGGVPSGAPFSPTITPWSAIPGKPNLITADDVTAPQGMVEFRWILPTSLYLPEPYRHTLCAALGDSLGSTAKVLIVDVSHESNTVETYELGTVPSDDHNAPAVITAPGDPIRVVWQHHGTNNNIYFKIGLPDRPDSLVTAPTQVVNVTDGLVAYAQLWNVAHLSNNEKVVDYMIYRNTLTEWYLLTVEVDRATLEVTTNQPGVHLITGVGSKPYITTATGARDAQIVRCAVGTNPADDTANSVSVFDIDLTTGDITSVMDDSFSANVDGTNLPIAAIGNDDLTFLPGTAAGIERRLLAVRPWPAPPGLLTAEGDPLDRPGTSHYYLQEWGGEYTEEDEGPAASATGLICPFGASPSYVRSPNLPSAAGASSIRVTQRLKLPATKPSNDWLDLYGQLNDASSTSGWYGWLGASVVGNELKPRFAVNRVGNTNHNLTCPNALSGVTWGARPWLRTTYTVAPTGSPSRRCTWEQSTDGVNWTEIGYHAGAAGALVVESGAYGWIGARALNRAGGLVVEYNKVEINGVTVSEIDFTNDSTGWPGYTDEYADPQGRNWIRMGQATIGRTTYGPTIPPQPIPVTNDLGLTGGSVDASYYPGAAFQGASVILARTDGINEELVLSHFSDGVLREKVLRTDPTSEGRYFRPMPPDNGGPLYCWLVKVRNYNDFYSWNETELHGVRRL